MLACIAGRYYCSRFADLTDPNDVRITALTKFKQRNPKMNTLSRQSLRFIIIGLLSLLSSSRVLAGTTCEDLPPSPNGACSCSGETCPSSNSCIGGAGNDNITCLYTTTTGSCVVIGRGGRDVIRGGAGNDYLCGGSGDDTIYTGGGTDNVIRGGSGNDNVSQF